MRVLFMGGPLHQQQRELEYHQSEYLVPMAMALPSFHRFDPNQRASDVRLAVHVYKLEQVAMGGSTPIRIGEGPFALNYKAPVTTSARIMAYMGVRCD